MPLSKCIIRILYFQRLMGGGLFPFCSARDPLSHPWPGPGGDSLGSSPQS